jgi:DNA-binding XRE family transcriptional regulator
MFPFELTAARQKQIATARAAGDRRVVLRLTAAQRRKDQAYVDSVDAEVREQLGVATPAPNAIASQIREARKSAGLTLVDVAERAGMTKQAVLKIESGQNANPKLDTIARIARAIGKDLRVELVG